MQKAEKMCAKDIYNRYNKFIIVSKKTYDPHPQIDSLQQLQCLLIF